MRQKHSYGRDHTSQMSDTCVHTNKHHGNPYVDHRVSVYPLRPTQPRDSQSPQAAISNHLVSFPVTNTSTALNRRSREGNITEGFKIKTNRDKTVRQFSLMKYHQPCCTVVTIDRKQIKTDVSALLSVPLSRRCMMQ